MNSVSSSLSVYQGPPVKDIEGSRPSSMYIFRVGYCDQVYINEWRSQDVLYLYRWDTFDEAFLSKCFQASIDDGLMEISFRLQMLRPDSYHRLGWASSNHDTRSESQFFKYTFIPHSLYMTKYEILLPIQVFCPVEISWVGWYLAFTSSSYIHVQFTLRDCPERDFPIGVNKCFEKAHSK